MQLLTLPASYPWVFWTLTVAWSAFQGVAGYQYGVFICSKGRPHAGQTVRKIYGFHHAALYVACAFAGFVAWHLLTALTASITDWSRLPGSADTVLLAIAAFSVLGVSGALARILYLGNKLW